MILTQHLQKEKLELDAKREKVDQKYQTELLANKMERLLQTNREEALILQRRIEERMERLDKLQTQQQTLAANSTVGGVAAQSELAL